MRDYGRALHAECLKLKRSQALGLMLLTPIMVAAMLFFAVLKVADLRGEGWDWFVPNAAMIWTAVFLPLCVALVTASLADVELRGRQWKHLFALPVPRGALYGAKFVVALALMAFGTAMLGVTTWLAGSILGVLLPEAGFDAVFPTAAWVRYAAVALPSIAFVLAIHTWVSLRFESFVQGIGLGFAGTIIAVFLAAQDLWPYFPWRLPLYLMQGFTEGHYDPRWLWAGVVGGLACLLVGGWDVTRRDVL